MHAYDLSTLKIRVEGNAMARDEHTMEHTVNVESMTRREVVPEDPGKTQPIYVKKHLVSRHEACKVPSLMVIYHIFNLCHFSSGRIAGTTTICVSLGRSKQA